MVKKKPKTLPEDATNDTNFKWTPVKEAAALLYAQDELTYDEMAEKLQVGRRTLGEWKLRPEFMSRVDAHVAEYRARIRAKGIAVIENRVAHLQRRHDKLNKVIEERGQSPEMQNVPGGRTGLMVHNVKSVGAGADAERIDLYEVDAALLKELREHEKQAAQELGQWSEKKDVTSDGKPLVVKVLSGVSMDDL